jgi:hypothetical protein
MASTLQQPAPLVEPFANSGDRNTIPQAATGTQRASLTEGFPPVTQLPIDRGGIPPERQDFNALGYLTTSQYFFLQNGGRFTFNPTVSAAIGGYPAGATLWYNDTARGVWYPVTSVINNNTYNFVQYPTYIDGTKWKRAVDAFPTTQITNCITEIPQDIKLELNNGVLTVKAGSKIYKPDGTYTISNADKTLETTVDGKYFIYTWSFTTLASMPLEYTFSGSTPPTLTRTSLWFDTTNNIIKQSSGDGSTWNGNIHLPIAVVTVSNGAISSIDQVFNGFGYIGSTVFALPGVKGLKPNGRNEDGTLKNTEFTLNTVLTNSTYRPSTNGYLICAGNATAIQKSAVKSHWYYDKDNNYVSTLKNDRSWMIWGEYTTDINDKIISFTSKLPFRAVDQNDFNDEVEKLDNKITKLESKFQVVTALPSSPTTGVFYFIKE